MSSLTLVPNCGEPESLEAVTERFEQLHRDSAAERYAALFASITECPERPAWKVQADLVAHGARAGFEVVQMADNSFVVGKWGMVAALADLAAVEAFLRKVGALE